jgi:hypothetical protein
MPVINNRTISSFVPGGEPASLGAVSAQSFVGTTGRYGTGPPVNGRDSSVCADAGE